MPAGYSELWYGLEAVLTLLLYFHGLPNFAAEQRHTQGKQFIDEATIDHY